MRIYMFYPWFKIDKIFYKIKYQTYFELFKVFFPIFLNPLFFFIL